MNELDKSYDVVRYSNGLNTVPLRKFTPVEMDIFWSVLSKMKRKGTQTVEFDFDVFKKLSKYDRSNRRHKNRFYNDLKSMADKMITLNYKFEDERYYEQLVLFQRFSIDKDEEKVVIQASERFEFILNNIEIGFTRFELDNVTNIDSSYVKELYRQLMQYKDKETGRGYWAVKVDEFRRLLAVPDSYRMSHIDSRILNKAKDEFLSEKDGRDPIFEKFTVEKIKAKKGNKIQRFVIRFKEYQDPNPVPMINWLEDLNE
ncbi:MAG: replication initiation protein [Tetragenococcus koreensis]|nr:replication initiation protein [Tetragenococcus koreensis]MDN6195743.1 replication initiation protein [Atopostipes suicloacalis]MDN6398728.1 replication initiation protein [Alkalibacterium sp.]